MSSRGRERSTPAISAPSAAAVGMTFMDIGDPRFLQLDHTHPEHGLAADVDVVLAYEGELAVVADAEDRQTGRHGPDCVAVSHVHWKIVLGHEHPSTWIDVERAWVDGSGLDVLDRARLAGRLI